MDATDARHTLSEIERVRHGTRREMNPLWFSNLVTGALFLGAALLFAANAGDAVAVFWVAGWVVALAVIIRFYARVERALGVEGRVWDPSVAIVAANVLTDSAALPVAAAAAGLLALGALLRDRIEAAAGAALAVLAAGLLALEPVELWAFVGLGVVLTLAGLTGRARDAA